MKNMNVEGNDYVIPLHSNLLFSGDFPRYSRITKTKTKSTYSSIVFQAHEKHFHRFRVTNMKEEL